MRARAPQGGRGDREATGRPDEKGRSRFPYPSASIGPAVARFARELGHALRNPRYLISAKVRRRMRYEALMGIDDVQARFTRIYEGKVWRGSRSASGTGSSLENTREIRERLPEIVRRYGVERLLDAPCGDFLWMQEVVRELPGLRYVGGDIVESLVAKNRRRFASERIRFEHLDITRDALPAADLMMVRDCLFHLSYADISRFLVNLARSDIGLLLTTTNEIEGGAVENRDIASGEFRPIDLFAEPFGFPASCLESFDDSDVSVVGKRMCLFRVGPLIAHLERHSTLYREGVSASSGGRVAVVRSS